MFKISLFHVLFINLLTTILSFSAISLRFPKKYFYCYLTIYVVVFEFTRVGMLGMDYSDDKCYRRLNFLHYYLNCSNLNLFLAFSELQQRLTNKTTQIQNLKANQSLNVIKLIEISFSKSLLTAKGENRLAASPAGRREEEVWRPPVQHRWSCHICRRKRRKLRGKTKRKIISLNLFFISKNIFHHKFYSREKKSFFSRIDRTM